MQKNNEIKLNYYLSPLSFLYGIGVWLRNRLFDWNVLHSEQYSIPVICIGNLSVGGTGKTPHTEYIIRLLKCKYRIAVLSPGGIKEKHQVLFLPIREAPVWRSGMNLFK